MPDTANEPVQLRRAPSAAFGRVAIEHSVLCAIAAVALVATRWTPRAPVRSACLAAATVALVAIVLRQRSRTEDTTLAEQRAELVAAAAVVLAAGVCCGSTEGPVLGGLAAVAVGAAGRRCGPGVRWAVIVASGCAVAAVIIWFGRWLHAWMQVPLAAVIVGEFLRIVGHRRGVQD